MNAIDHFVLEFLNQWARQSSTFDHLVSAVAFNDALKGMIPVGLIAALWVAAAGESRNGVRSRLLHALVSTAVALALNRILASVLPHRDRPIHVTPPILVPPFGISLGAFNDLSSFPSDHAVMFVGLALGIASVSGRLGVLAFVHAVVVAILPRLYLGLHFLTDVLAGAGLALAVHFALGGIQRPSRHLRALQWTERWPRTSGFLLASLLFGFATLFDPFVKLATTLKRLL